MSLKRTALVALVAVAGLAGCTKTTTRTTTANGQEIGFWTDPETGCDYIAPVGLLSASAPVQPRIAADGKSVHCAAQKAAAKPTS